ncbi:MAG: RnfABCDGE type electron transport complex subunit G [bacterium]|nr:RnfABCDGE type electron transport complex subunit G [bacterium]
MKEMLNLSIRLALICAVAAILLSQIASLTAEPIRLAELQVAMEAVQSVLPAFDNAPGDDAVTLDIDGRSRKFYVGKSGGKVTGVAFEANTQLGYSGEIIVMMGVTADGKANGVRILKHAETPGLGANYDDPQWLDGSYKGHSSSNTNWKVKKDGGDLDALTGATVTARALADAVSNGLITFEQNRDKIITGEVR